MSIRDSLGMLWGSTTGSRTPVDKTSPLPVALYDPAGSGNPAGGSGSSGGTQTQPFYDIIVSDGVGTQPLGTPTDAAAASGSGGTLSAYLRAIKDRILGTLTTMVQDAFVPPGSPFSASATGVLFTVDTTGYQSIAVQLTGTFAATVTYEASNDGTTWTQVIGGSPASSTGGGSAADATVGTRCFAAGARYFRARVSAYTSGTVVASPSLRSTPVSFPGSVVAVSSDTTAGTTADAAYAGSGNAGVIAVLKGIYNACIAATPVGSNIIGSLVRALSFTEATNTAVTASNSLFGSTRDAGATIPWSKFNAVGFSTQTGTLSVQGSSDGSTWITVASTAIAASTAATLSVPVIFRYHRALIANGATAATASLSASYTAA